MDYDYREAMKLENQLCFPLYAAARTITNLYTPYLKALGLTYTQYLVFLVLWEKDGITVGEICKKLMLDSGTLSPLLKKMQQQGYLVTPMFIRTKWLGDMNEFRAMRENFMSDYMVYCGQWYLKRFMMIKNIPGVISAEEYETQKQIVAEQCSKEAQDAFVVYKHRWNIQ